MALGCPCDFAPDDVIRRYGGLDRNLANDTAEWLASKEDAFDAVARRIGDTCATDLCARIGAQAALSSTQLTDIATAQVTARQVGTDWAQAAEALRIGNAPLAGTESSAAIAGYAALLLLPGWTAAYAPTKDLYIEAYADALAAYTAAVPLTGAALTAELAKLNTAASVLLYVELAPLRVQDVTLRERLYKPYSTSFVLAFQLHRRYREAPAGPRTGNNAQAGIDLNQFIGQKDAFLQGRHDQAWEDFEAWYSCWEHRCGGCSSGCQGKCSGGCGCKCPPVEVKIGPQGLPGESGTGGVTDLGVNRTGTAVTVTSSTGADATIPAASGTEAGVMTAADKNKLDGVAPGSTAYTDTQADARVAAGIATHVSAPDPHTQYALESDVSASLALKADLVGGFVPASQLPASVDQIDEFANLAAFPAVGVSNRIYVALDTNLTYRWSGSAYVEISPSLALGSTSSTAHRGDHGVAAYTHSQITSGNPHGTSKADLGLGSVDDVSAANLRDRATHTGAQPISSVTGLQAALDAKPDLALIRAWLWGTAKLGDVTVTGSVTPPQQPHYNNLTIGAGAAFTLTNGYWVYVADTLDLTACPANGIRFVANAGGNASGTAAGAQAGAQTGLGVGAGQRGNTASAGGTTTGTQSPALTAAQASNGRVAGTSGAGGTGSSGAGGAARAPSAATDQTPSRIATNWLNGITLILGGGGGSGGGSGGGDGTAGGGSGAGGNGGGCIVIFARRINRGAGTAAQAIQARGGAGGNGGVPAGGNRGGGGGGSGGAGGTIYIVYEELLGTPATNALDVTGGAGGAGGNGTGTGTGGNAGGGGEGGKVVLINALTGVITQFAGPAATAGNAASGTTGGAATPATNAFFIL